MLTQRTVTVYVLDSHSPFRVGPIALTVVTVWVTTATASNRYPFLNLHLENAISGTFGAVRVGHCQCRLFKSNKDLAC